MNLKPAPFDLTESVVSMALGDRPGLSTRVVHVPVLPTKLVDRPRRSEEPRLAKANDDSIFPTPSARMDGGFEPVRVAPAQAASSVPVESPNLGRPDTADSSGAAHHA